MRFAIVLALSFFCVVAVAAGILDYLETRRRKAHFSEDTYTQQGLMALERLANKERSI